MARPVGQVANPAGNAAQGDLLGPMDDGHDQSLVGQVDGDAQVDLGMHHQRVVHHGGIEQREVAHRLHRRSGHKRQIGQREALFGLEPLAPGLADPLDILEIRLVGDEGVG